MNRKLKTFILITLGYAVVGPAIGGLLVGFGYLLRDLIMGTNETFDVMAPILFIGLGYLVGLIPAVASGLYVAWCAARQKIIHLPIYYVLATLPALTMALIPIMAILRVPPPDDGASLPPEERPVHPFEFRPLDNLSTSDYAMLAFTMIVPLTVGAISAALLLKLVRRRLAASSFALKFKSSTAEA
jgi:hypothetical protein